MTDYDYVTIDVSQLTRDELEELVAQAVEDSIDTCKWSEDGKFIVLKWRGEMPALFAEYRSAVSSPQKAHSFRTSVLSDARLKFQHDKSRDNITLQTKKRGVIDTLRGLL